MQFRRLGRSDLRVSPLCFGGNVFGWTADEAMSFKLLDRFVEAGMNFVDTADGYSRWVPGNKGGESETIIGNWMKSRGARSRLVVATKLGAEIIPGRKGLSKAYMREAVEASLRRLGTDYIDLYQSHFDDPDTPFEETLEGYDELIRAGKVRAIGASNLNPERLTEALAVSERTGLPRYESLQPHYNLCDRAVYEDALEEVCVEHGLGVINYYALASGFLSGKYRNEADTEGQARGTRVAKYLNPRGMRILAALDAVAAAHAANPAQVALAWLIARPSITAPIASATRLDQLEDLIASAFLTLSSDDIAQLDAASAA